MNVSHFFIHIMKYSFHCCILLRSYGSGVVTLMSLNLNKKPARISLPSLLSSSTVEAFVLESDQPGEEGLYSRCCSMYPFITELAWNLLCLCHVEKRFIAYCECERFLEADEGKGIWISPFKQDKFKERGFSVCLESPSTLIMCLCPLKNCPDTLLWCQAAKTELSAKLRMLPRECLWLY